MPRLAKSKPENPPDRADSIGQPSRLCLKN